MRKINKDKVRTDWEIFKFLFLKKDWNGYAANRFKLKTVINGIKFYNNLDYPMSIFPIMDGRIQFENEVTEGENQYYLEFVIDEKGRVDMLLVVNNKWIQSKTNPVNNDEKIDWDDCWSIQWLCSNGYSEDTFRMWEPYCESGIVEGILK